MFSIGFKSGDNAGHSMWCGDPGPVGTSIVVHESEPMSHSGSQYHNNGFQNSIPIVHGIYIPIERRRAR